MIKKKVIKWKYKKKPCSIEIRLGKGKKNIYILLYMHTHHISLHDPPYNWCYATFIHCYTTSNSNWHPWDPCLKCSLTLIYYSVSFPIKGKDVIVWGSKRLNRSLTQNTADVQLLLHLSTFFMNIIGHQVGHPAAWSCLELPLLVTAEH